MDFHISDLLSNRFHSLKNDQMTESAKLRDAFRAVREAIADARTEAGKHLFDEDARSLIRANIEQCIVDLQTFMRRMPPPRTKR